VFLGRAEDADAAHELLGCAEGRLPDDGDFVAVVEGFVGY
jgi:hypothetical protein